MTARIVAMLLIAAAARAEEKKDPWAPLRFIEGDWRGTGEGQPGKSKVEQRYGFVLGGHFIETRSTAVYAPQEKNPKGERHEEMGFISFDKARGKFVWRQFHKEGFVNQYTAELPDEKTVVFTSEAIENIPAGWRARETFTVVSPREIVQRFELAAPGKEFEVYSENRLKRKR
jgi:hypothetical protein